jgi:hypothetical protein
MKVLLVPLALAACALAADPPALLVSRADAEAIHKAIARNEKWTVGPAAVLRAEAERLRKAGPWSVTDARPKNVQVDPHDYYSEGPYWWPDPANPKAPYIRRDGEVNPEHFTANRRALGSMAEAVFALGAAGYFLDDGAAGYRASQLLWTWFVDPATRMNPNLEYGQAIPGRTSGRGAGIIDTRPFIYVIQAIELLDAAGRIDTAARGNTRRWFADYARWLVTSKKGLDEKTAGNNHSTWWAAQVAAYASLFGDEPTRRMAYDWLRTGLFPKQIRPDGSAPLEEARTRSLGYSTFNFEAYALLCRMAEQDGVDLWRMRTPQGATLETVAALLAPGWRDPASWRKQQITDFNSGNLYYAALAGKALGRPEYIRLYWDKRKPAGAWQAFIELLLGPPPAAAPQRP